MDVETTLTGYWRKFKNLIFLRQLLELWGAPFFWDNDILWVGRVWGEAPYLLFGSRHYSVFFENVLSLWLQTWLWHFCNFIEDCYLELSASLLSELWAWDNVRTDVYTHKTIRLKPHHLFMMKRTIHLSREMKRLKRRESRRDTFCFWKIVSVSYWRKRDSAAQRGAAGELKASRSQAAHREHERWETPKTLRVFDDVVRASNTGTIQYLMTFLMKGFDKDHSSHKLKDELFLSTLIFLIFTHPLTSTVICFQPTLYWYLVLA